MFCKLDLFTRETKGLAVDSHMRTSVVMIALRMAVLRAGITQKRGAKGLSLGVNAHLLSRAYTCKTKAIGRQ